MSLCVRKFNPSKWDSCTGDGVNPVPADAITICLKTSKNSLSVWHANSADDEVEFVDIAIALILNPNPGNRVSGIEKHDFVLLEPQEVRELGLRLVRSRGNTLFENLIERHLDIIDLDYPGLGVVSEIIRTKIIEQKIKKVGRAEIKARFHELIESGVLNNSHLFPENVRRDLGL